MRHFLPAPLAVVLHPGRVLSPPVSALLVPSPSRPLRLSPGRGGTPLPAVQIAVITGGADQDLLVTPRAVVQPVGVGLGPAASPRTGRRLAAGSILRDDFSPGCGWKVWRLGGRSTFGRASPFLLPWYQSHGRAPTSPSSCPATVSVDPAPLDRASAGTPAPAPAPTRPPGLFSLWGLTDVSRPATSLHRSGAPPRISPDRGGS
jgi:hypothetical protein